MEEIVRPVGSLPSSDHSAEGMMLREDVVQAILARLARGEGVKRIARELGVDRKTVKRWQRRGQWRPRPSQPRPSPLDPYAAFLERRAPEVGWNGAVLYREVRGLGFAGGSLQVQRFLQPLRAERRWVAEATIRVETGPGEQAQVDFGPCAVWIGEQPQTVHLFVYTLGFSRRLGVQAYPHERLDVVLAGHEGAFGHVGGVPLECLYDTPRTLVLGRREGRVLWHPVVEDVARYDGFTRRAYRPYRARTKGKVESGVTYVTRNALAGRRFPSWEALNAWRLEWSATVADLRLHGTTHERPLDRFAREGLTPLGARPPYRYERLRTRRVPSDALVAIGAARYSVPVQYVGTLVTVHETASHDERFAGDTRIARHARAARHTVVMDPTHYAGLLRPGAVPPPPAPPQWEPAYHALGEVVVRDLATYAAIAEGEGRR